MGFTKPDAAKVAEAAQALGHPLRVRILGIMRADGRWSPSRVAKELNEPLHGVGYHMRNLTNLGAISLEEERVARGTIEHLYEITPAGRAASTLAEGIVSTGKR